MLTAAALLSDQNSFFVEQRDQVNLKNEKKAKHEKKNINKGVS